MTTFSIEALYSEHEGRTKYYQIFWITNSKDKKAIMVTHWGAMRPGKAKYPKHHGEAQVETFVTGTDTPKNSKQKSKSNRGYREWSSEHWNNIESEDFLEAIEDIFKEREGSQIKAYFHDVGDWATAVSIPEIEARLEENEKAILATFEQANPEPSQHNADYGTW